MSKVNVFTAGCPYGIGSTTASCLNAESLKTANLILPSIHMKNTYVFQIKFGSHSEVYAEISKHYFTIDSG